MRINNATDAFGNAYLTEADVNAIIQAQENMTDTELENIIKERLNSPRQYGLDGEQVTNDSAKELAQLIALYKSVKSKKRSTSMRISVCRGNGTV